MSKSMNEKNRAENAIDAARLCLSPSGGSKARLAFTSAEDLFEVGRYGHAARQALRSLRMSRSGLQTRVSSPPDATRIFGTKAA